MADRSVRPGRLIDVAALVEVQRRAWRSLPTGLWAVPDVDSLDADAMVRSWERAVLLPPTPRHRLLVALEGGTVVGGAATTPAEDPDLSDAVTVDPERSLADELVLLVVDPDHRRGGHGSRLMAAAADLVRAAGVPMLVTWVPAADDVARGWLVAAGWATDGAHRTVELDGRVVRELRFATDVRQDPA